MALPIRNGYLKNTTATEKGFVDTKGKLVHPKRLTPEEIAEWNGTVEETEVEVKTTKKSKKQKKDEEETTVITEEYKKDKTGILAGLFNRK